MEHIFELTISCLLAVNVYFLKDMVKGLNQVKVELGKLITSHDNTSENVKENSGDIKDLYKTVNTLRDKISKMEGELTHLNN